MQTLETFVELPSELHPEVDFERPLDKGVPLFTDMAVLRLIFSPWRDERMANFMVEMRNVE